MRVDLHAATGVAQYVLFDPAAIPDWIRHDLPFPSGFDWLDEPATQGNLLDYRDICDGELRARLYIDEEPEPRLMKIATPLLAGAVLRVPSGKLWMMGAEWLPAADAASATPPTYRPDGRDAVSETSIPAGIYLVEAFEISPEQREELIAQELGPEFT